MFFASDSVVIGQPLIPDFLAAFCFQRQKHCCRFAVSDAGRASGRLLVSGDGAG